MTRAKQGFDHVPFIVQNQHGRMPINGRGFFAKSGHLSIDSKGVTCFALQKFYSKENHNVQVSSKKFRFQEIIKSKRLI
jgi:hypothetical protein